mmetsp:Transcript_11730/g.35742  ORF Transcript_11730/g.35742 Transcript_11730/m.35742 type:complete len:205 (+) Transcript_11730:84-698(+)
MSQACAIPEDREQLEDDSLSHPLQFSWCLWFDSNVNARGAPGFAKWDSGLRLVSTATTVEEFWRAHAESIEPSKLKTPSTYHFFKEGIQPRWEDPENEPGGKLTLTFPKRDPNTDTFWLNTLLMLIGDRFEADESDDICGAVLAIRRKNDRISLWLKSGLNAELCASIETQWRRGICENGLSAGRTIAFTTHAEEKERHAAQPV